MTQSMKRILVIAALVALAACGGGVSLDLPDEGAMQVVSDGNSEFLQPADQRYVRFHSWLKHNRDGWSKAYATNPSGGVLVRLETLQFQFVGGTVFASTSNGMFSKPVKELEYAFLSQAGDT